MADTVRDSMTPDPASCEASDSVTQAAQAMRDGDFGAVIVTESDTVTGIVTDRDIAVRAVAEGKDPDDVTVGEIASGELEALSPDDDLSEAIEKVEQADIRRLPVVEDGKPVGILSLGDLAIERDSDSALADISSSPANN